MKIQQWQIEKGFDSHPLYYMWLHILHKGCVDNFKWIKNFSALDSTSESWEIYYKELQSSIPTDDSFILNIPNADTKKLWEYKATVLKTFLIRYYNVLQYVTIDPFINDIYREKTDQAINYASRTIDYIPIFLRNPYDPTDADYALNEATLIINKRAKWTSVTAQMDTIRRKFINHALEHDLTEKLDNLLQNSIDLLDDIYKKWI